MMLDANDGKRLKEEKYMEKETLAKLNRIPEFVS